MSAFSRLFTLNLHCPDGEVRQYAYHLGKDEAVARRCAEAILRAYGVYGKLTKVTLLKGLKTFDTYDGCDWQTEFDNYERNLRVKERSW